MKKDIRKLTINPINPRKISTEMRRRLQQSIMLFPRMLYFRDIIVNEEGVVLAGNQRTSILKEILNTTPLDWMLILQENEFWKMKKESWKEKWIDYWKKWTENPLVHVTVAKGLTVDEEKELVIKDNNEYGEFNFEQLKQMYDEVTLVNFGFDPQLFYNIEEDKTTIKKGALGTSGKKIDVLTFGKNTIAVSVEEYQSLAARYDAYVANVGVDFGFIKSLFGEGQV